MRELRATKDRVGLLIPMSHNRQLSDTLLSNSCTEPGRAGEGGRKEAFGRALSGDWAERSSGRFGERSFV